MLRFLLPLLFALLIPVAASAEWTAGLASHSPEYLLAADKSRKLLFQVERLRNDPVITRQFDCIHGRREGDKQKEGDLRTPEGVYFITHKITQKLDFMEYGPHAFNLNYPNPADRLRGKTGSGIWLHSKGQPIAGLTTRGCMAIEQNEITDLVPILVPGTPVIIAEHLEGRPFMSDPSGASDLPGVRAPVSASLPVTASAENDFLPPSSPFLEKVASAPSPKIMDAQEKTTSAPSASHVPVPSADDDKVLSLTLTWMDDLSHRSEDIFLLYDEKNYPRASRETFSALRKRLRAEFKKQDDLFLDREGISLLAGPGYLVSCFIKSYQYQGEYFHGLQALYWMPDAQGQYRIIGELWIKN